MDTALTDVPLITATGGAAARIKALETLLDLDEFIQEVKTRNIDLIDL